MTRKSHRQLWTDQLLNKRRGWKARGGKEMIHPRASCVLGVDPSLRSTGIAVLDAKNPRAVKLLHQDTWKLHKLPSVTACLASIQTSIQALFQRYPIDHLAIENSIYVQNVRIAQSLGAVKGVILAAATVAGIPVFEYAPLSIKRATLGYGLASKEQIANFICQSLALEKPMDFDASDAAATALCHLLGRGGKPPS